MRKVSIRIEEELLQEINVAAKQLNISRVAFFRMALEERLQELRTKEANRKLAKSSTRPSFQGDEANDFREV